ncbi:DegT/DnrJ/EryC1/StrS family aminotransferase [Streptomyces sp. GZWMJZ-114]|uniref:DegT/DnrJ/EryC1/StrS family aminotransferase n=1 Tax=Streptomyces sp. GZWMJZ-114 TaxID=2494734 RepID=UPI0013E92A04|nr:DegT/DnrJ/EryC1/StrS family aminotransferase [Streptomyces sp. GZWMJZ-114]
MSASVGFDWPPVGPAQEAAVLACLREGDLSLPFRVTRDLETAVGAYLGVKHVVAHCNGTSAMLSALYAAGVEAGTEVVCPSYTWWASVAPALWLNASPVFCDIEPENLTINVRDVLSRVTPRTRAVVVPHLWGAMADIDTVISALRREGITVIEDASHVFGASSDGRFLGTIGDLGVFSMQAQKALPAGEGGLLVTSRSDLYERSLAVGHYERLTRVATHEHYLGTGLGLKSRISPLNAALALSYLPTLAESLARYEELTQELVKPLTANGLVRFAGMQDHVRHGGRTALRLVADSPGIGHVPAERIANALIAVGLPAKPEYLRPLHRLPLFSTAASQAGELPVTDSLFPRLIHVSLPVAGAPSSVRELGKAAFRGLEGLIQER